MPTCDLCQCVFSAQHSSHKVAHVVPGAVLALVMANLFALNLTQAASKGLSSYGFLPCFLLPWSMELEVNGGLGEGTDRNRMPGAIT
jgi:hypothetical protein